MVSVGDASSANKRSDFATEGGIVGLAEDRVQRIEGDKNDFITDDLVKKLGGKLHIYIGSSQKSKRVSHSTSHAETLSAAKFIPTAQLAAIRLTEPEIVTRLGKRSKPLALLEVQEEALCPLPVDAYVDCMDLWDLACGVKGMPQDKSQRLGVLAIREERRSLRLRRLYHLRTRYMLADMLTKATGVDSRSLLELVSSGHWTIDSDVRCREGFGIGYKNNEVQHAWLVHPDPEEALKRTFPNTHTTLHLLFASEI